MEREEGRQGLPQPKGVLSLEASELPKVKAEIPKRPLFVKDLSRVKAGFKSIRLHS